MRSGSCNCYQVVIILLSSNLNFASSGMYTLISVTAIKFVHYVAVINSTSAVTYHLDLSNFLLESGLFIIGLLL